MPTRDCWGSHITPIPGHPQQHPRTLPTHSPARHRKHSPEPSRADHEQLTSTRPFSCQKHHEQPRRSVSAAEALPLPGEEQPWHAVQPGPEIALRGSLLLLSVRPRGTRSYTRSLTFLGISLFRGSCPAWEQAHFGQNLLGSCRATAGPGLGSIWQLLCHKKQLRNSEPQISPPLARQQQDLTAPPELRNGPRRKGSYKK